MLLVLLAVAGAAHRAHAPGSTKAKAAQLTARIKRAPTVPALLDEHAKCCAEFNEIHVSAFWVRVGQLRRGWHVDDAMAIAALVPVLAHTLELLPGDGFRCRQLTGTGNGLAKSGLGHAAAVRPVWDALAAGVKGRLDEYKPREVATTAWSFAKAGVGGAHPSLYAALELEALGRLPEFTPQGLANMGWAFAKAGHPAPRLFDELESEVTSSEDRLADFASRELCALVWAYAALAHPAAARVCVAVAREARDRLDDFTLHELATMGWSLAAADAVAAGDLLFGGGSPFVALCEELLAECPANAGTLTQLWQWQLWTSERTGRGWRRLSDAPARRCREAFLTEPIASPSSFEESVCAALQAMGLQTARKVCMGAGVNGRPRRHDAKG